MATSERVGHTPNPAPAVAPDADQFFRVVLLDHVEVCSEEDCTTDTLCAAETSETKGTKIPYCNAHVHVAFADWMVGV